jgi:hypothetical protein
MDAALNALDSLGVSLPDVPADVAERRINDLLSSFDVSFPKLNVPGVGQAHAPAKNPLYV